jgi:hypothetical protein
LDRFLDNEENRIPFGWINYVAAWPLDRALTLPAGVTRKRLGDGVLVCAIDTTFPQVPPGNAQDLRALFGFWKKEIETD